MPRVSAYARGRWSVHKRRRCAYSTQWYHREIGTSTITSSAASGERPAVAQRDLSAPRPASMRARCRFLACVSYARRVIVYC